MNKEIRDYILEVGGFNDRTNWGDAVGAPALCRQVDYMIDGRTIKTPEQAGYKLAEGGQWAVYTEDARKDLKEVWGLDYDGEDVFERYCRACAVAVAMIYKGAI